MNCETIQLVDWCIIEYNKYKIFLGYLVKLVVLQAINIFMRNDPIFKLCVVAFCVGGGFFSRAIRLQQVFLILEEDYCSISHLPHPNLWPSTLNNTATNNQKCTGVNWPCSSRTNSKVLKCWMQIYAPLQTCNINKTPRGTKPAYWRVKKPTWTGRVVYSR